MRDKHCNLCGCLLLPHEAAWCDVCPGCVDSTADARAVETYEAWKRDPSGAVPLERFEAELIAEGLLDAGT